MMQILTPKSVSKTWGNISLFGAVMLAFVWSGNAQAQVYCTSTATSTFDSNVGLVQLNTINNSTLGICATYSDFTNLSTNLTIGNSYPVTVTLGTCGGNYTKYGKVYIDYNRDFDFLDPGEEVYAFGPASATQTFTQNITVPGTASLGSTRMRVVGVETGSLASVLSCGTFTWGETEDYTVNIMPSAPNDIGVSQIVSPNSGCSLGSSEPVTIRVSNFGTNTQSAWNVHYRVNGGPIVTESMSGQNLASGAGVNYTFTATANLGAPGTYTLKAWTSMGTDAFAMNDSTTKIVTGIPGVNTYPYFENFETNNGGWLPGGNLSTWAYGTPAKTVIQGASSGTKAYVTGGLGTGTYNNNEDSFILGPCFDFSTLQNPWISLRIWWHAETVWDGSNVQYSTDFGTTWTNVGAAFDPGNWYNYDNILSTPGDSPDGWTGSTPGGSPPSSGGWLTAAHRLDGLAGAPSVRIRITFGADGSVVYDGTAIDDIRIADGPVANLGNDTLICGGDSITLSPGVFAAYQWNGGNTGPTQVVNQNNTGQITVKITDNNGFYDFDTVLVSISNPQVAIGPDSSICPGDSVFLTAGNHPGGFFQWSNGDTSSSIYATIGGTYSVLVTDSVGCQNSDAMVLSVLIPPSLSLGNDTSICVGQPVALDGGPGPNGTTYQWNNGSTTQIILVSSPGVYSASVTTPGGCAAIDTVEVLQLPAPAVSLGQNRVECAAFTLDAGPGGTTYLWSTGDVTQTITSNATGTYAVTVTNSLGCSTSDDVLITRGTVPTVNIGPDQVLCNGLSIPLNAGNPGSTYLWSNAATTQNINVTVAGTYFVQVTNSQGCNGSDSVVIGSSQLAVNLGPNVNMCGNQPVVLNAGNPGSTYLWSNGATTQSVLINQTGTYTVTVTDNIGCSATDAINVGQVAGVTAAFNGPATGLLLQPTAFTDQSTGGAIQWFWDFGDGASSTQQNPQHTYQSFGTFTVTLIASDGNCRDTVTNTIVINNFVGMEEGEFAKQVQVYPNPSQGIFNLVVEFDKPKAMTVEVADLTGKVLFSTQHPALPLVEQTIDLGGMAQGVYILKLSSDGREVFHRLMLQ